MQGKVGLGGIYFEKIVFYESRIQIGIISNSVWKSGV